MNEKYEVDIENVDEDNSSREMVDIHCDTYRNKATMNDLRSLQDSDSDIEDFLHIINESRNAFEFTQTVVSKLHRDHLDGSTIHDDREFVSLICFACFFVNSIFVFKNKSNM